MLCDTLTRSRSAAKKAGAVNTVNNIEGIFRGYNTDIYGFIEPLRKRQVDFRGMHVLLLGSGGPLGQ